MSLRYTVVIDCYNYRDYVCEAVDSALAQRLPPAEILVIDDGSTDGSRERLEQRYGDEPRVRLISQPNGGQLSTFVTGVTAARGDVVCFLDADDVWEPDHLEQLDAAYALPCAPDFVFTNLRYFGQREGLWQDDGTDHDHGLTAIAAFVQRSWIGSPTSALSMRRRLAEQVLDLPPLLVRNWRSGGDNVLVLGASLFGAHKFYRAAVTVRYRAHGSNFWLGRRDVACKRLQHDYQCDQLFAHYAARTGLGPASLRLARREFETKPRPTRDELRQYSRLARQAALPLGKRLELLLKIRLHYWRSHRAAA